MVSTYLNSRFSFRIILGRERVAVKKCNDSGCDGENNEEKLQRIKVSLEFFVLLFQDKRTNKKYSYFSLMNPKPLSAKDKSFAFNIFLILAAIFISSLVVSNLIFQKFFSWDFLGWYNFEISVGILPYPITFLVTDLISEIYGKKKANQVVITGIFASAFSFLSRNFPVC